MAETLRKKPRSGRGLSAGLRPAPAEAEATSTSTSKAGFLRDGGVGPVAGDAVNPSMGAWPRHPCRGHSRHRTHPAFDSFPRSAVDPRRAWMLFVQLSKYSISMEIHPRMAWIYWPPAYCRRRGTVGLRGVSGMDAATKPPGTGLRRPRKPTVSRHPTECPLLLLLRPLPWLEAGAGCNPAEPPTTVVWPDAALQLGASAYLITLETCLPTTPDTHHEAWFFEGRRPRRHPDRRLA